MHLKRKIINQSGQKKKKTTLANDDYSSNVSWIKDLLHTEAFLKNAWDKGVIKKQTLARPLQTLKGLFWCYILSVNALKVVLQLYILQPFLLPCSWIQLIAFQVLFLLVRLHIDFNGKQLLRHALLCMVLSRCKISPITSTNQFYKLHEKKNSIPHLCVVTCVKELKCWL